MDNAKAQTDRIWAAIKNLEIFPGAHQNRIVGRYAGKGYKQLIIDSTFPCSSEQSFLGSLHGGNDRQIAEQIAESGVHAGRAPAQKAELSTGHPFFERDRA